MRYLIGIFLFLLFGGLQAADTALTVSTVSPTRELVEKTVTGIGYIAPREEALVNARINGATLREIYVHLGEKVKKGQILARFDDAEMRTDVAIAKAQTARAETALKQAQKNAGRAKSLLKASAMSRIEGERLFDNAETALANLSIAKAHLDAQMLRLTYTEVKAPVSGIITAKQAILGETVSIGKPLFRMMVDAVPAWQAQVPTADIAMIKDNTVAKVSLPDGSVVKGYVYNIAPTIDRQSREATVFVSLPAHPELRVGMLLEGVFNLGRSEQMLIPANTIQPDDGHYYVWLVDTQNTVHRQQIDLGGYVGEMAEIRSGLQDDSRIVARGGAFLVEGNKVRVVDLPGAQP